MAKKFFPIVSEMVNAEMGKSDSHPEGTQYRVSIGRENWGNGKFVLVSKVQMVYDGKISGRRSPSYPIDTNDYERVQETMKQLHKDIEKIDY